MSFKASELKIYFICGTQDIPENQTIQDILTQALEAGITMFQFREKGDKALSGLNKEKLAKSYKRYVTHILYHLLLMMMCL